MDTWDVHSVATHVLLPDGLAIHVGLKHNATVWQDAFLSDALIGRQGPRVKQVIPGPHAWDGRYTELRLSWRGHNLLVLLASPLSSSSASAVPASEPPGPSHYERFDPLLAKAATSAQADIMIKKHLLNPREFWGEWVFPRLRGMILPLEIKNTGAAAFGGR